MKRVLIAIAAAAAAVFISGCGTTAEERKAQSEQQAALVNLQALHATARIREAEAEVELAKKLDAGGAAAAYMAKYLKGLGAPPAPQAVQQPQSIAGMAWQAVLQVADLALRGWGLKVNRDVSLRSAELNRDVTLGAYSTFAAMGGSIERAGTAGYPFIQAPPANVTNTYTLQGTGVLGSGTYTGPVTTTTTTTRNCYGGTAGPGGAGTPTAPGTPGGGAPGGNC